MKSQIRILPPFNIFRLITIHHSLVMFAFLMMSSTLWAQSSIFVVPLAHNKEVSIPMGKGFDTHVRNYDVI